MDVQSQLIQSVSRAQAEAIVEAAIVRADEVGAKMNIAILDAGANLKAFVRMDGALLGSIDVAMKKARTAILFQMQSADLGQDTQPGGTLYSAQLSNGGLITFPGGVPLRAADGSIIGSIGVSGSTVENDLAVAEAGASVLQQFA